MNRVNERLTELFHAATPEPPTDVPFEGVVRRVRRRRRMAAAGTALATVAVLSVGAAFLPQLVGHDRQDVAAPERKLTVPGMDEKEEARLLGECRPRPQPTDRPPSDNPDRDREREEFMKQWNKWIAEPYRVYNRVDAPGGFYALLYNERISVLCGRDSRPAEGGGVRYGQLRTGTSGWLGDDLSVDATSVDRKGVTPRDGSTVRPPKQLLQVVAGRVSDRVAKVTFDGADGSSTTVRPVNGTFIATIYLEVASASALAGPNGGGELIGAVSVFDADGRFLQKQGGNEPPGCYVRPDGMDISTGKKPDPAREPCKPATRWNP